ncbi:sensor histidine kinase [Kitasatospora sp. NPDC058162]|uniref:sensor histidine kinase n=1 Tax=Kitasatospora sp. NPDC058162 TaxID=3346362 RepID=UPI0036DF18A9
MKLPTPYRAAAGLIYLSVGSLVGLLLAPLVVLSLLLRVLSWLLLVGLPMLVVLCVRALTAAFRRVARPGPAAAGGGPPARPSRTWREHLRDVPARLAFLRDGISFSLPLLRAVAELEQLLARFVHGVDGPREPVLRAIGLRRERRRPPEATWDDIGYLGLLLLGAVWLAPLAALAVPVVAFVVALPIGPPDQLAFGPGNNVVVDGAVTRLLVAACSVLVFVLLLGLLLWLGRLRARMVRRVLGRIEQTETRRREAAAERQRVAALRVNDADFRRVERDLHDGAQARLAALLMHLSHARLRRGDDAEYLAAVVGEAHQEVSKAIEEIRDLVRGIQPPILSDRGLDAAVTALTERFHVPVSISSTLDRRPDVRVESTAYYVIAECLANTAKYAGATAIHIALEQGDDRLVVSVTDDGVGGASPAEGTGLRGLEDRAAAINGRLDVSSPPGGPTTVRATLPWSVTPV